MYTSKRYKSNIKMTLKELIGKTREETDLILYKKGFKKNEEDIYVRKTNLLSTAKLEIYSENNITLMITFYKSFLKIPIYENVLI
ncbi:hypothetical protein [Epilithonimonas caeni]|uniref:hypothetical protein n=1 Tax=Epilithonimonas caeni TaxID=365343 RepID=UPI0003F704C4|nr:hypothetical protein [Epilithonimonas caeni]